MFRLLITAAVALAIAGCAAGRPPQTSTKQGAPSSASSVAQTQEFVEQARRLHSPRLMAMALLREAETRKDADRAVLAAMFAAQGGDYKLADQATGLARRLAPGNPEPYIAQVRIALDQGDVKAAREAAARAYALAGAGAVRAALAGPIDPWFVYAVARPLARHHSGDAELALLNAEAALEVGDARAALAAASSAAAAGPPASVLQAQALWNLGRHREALAKSAAAVAAAAHNVGLRVFYAGLLIQAREFDQAREVLGDARALAPADPHVVLAYAQLDVVAGEPAKARARLTRLLEAGTESGGVYNLLGSIAAKAHEWGEAFGWYQAIDDNNFVSSAQVAATFALANWQGLDPAERYLRRLERVFPALAPTWLGSHAALLVRAGQRDQAYALLVKAAKRYPAVLDLRYQQAVLADELDKSRTALALMRGLLAEQPDNPEYLNAYGYTLAERTSRYHEAYGYIERALSAEPDNGAFLDSMGWVLYRLGESHKALPYLRRAWSLTGDVDVAEHLVTVYLALGRQAEASRVLVDALAKAPDNAKLLKLKAQLLSSQPPH